jgi:2-keto-4-pentenoate hydratase/2-oxohepta-3-ene-1,7-dioic acid hydratase in catechol pathway
MKLAALYGPGTERSSLHLAVGEGFVPVDDLEGAHAHPELLGLADVAELFRLGGDALDVLRSLEAGAEPTVAPEDARFAPPVRRPGKIVCVGLNYLAHIEESRTERSERIVLFSKFASCLVSHREPIVIPPITSQLDYEGELAVIIGKTARGVSQDSAMEYVGGFTIIDDVSARDLQGSEPQWIRGKALDTFAPLGPVVIDARSAPPMDEMRIRTMVNGELRQNELCSMMITPVPRLIEYISACITLDPGDIIATGTPSGVAGGMDVPVWLKDGDEVRISISGIGELSNPVTAP